MVKKFALTAIKNKIPDVSGLATNFSLTVVENKIPDVSSLVKKTDYDGKISDIEKKMTDHNHDKYITTPEDVFNARLAAQTDLMKNPDFGAKLKAISHRVTKNKSKNLLVESEFKKFDASYFRGKTYFNGNGTQNYLVFQRVYNYFNAVEFEISSWKSKGLFNEEIASIINSDSATPKIVYDNARITVKCNRNFLK